MGDVREGYSATPYGLIPSETWANYLDGRDAIIKPNGVIQVIKLTPADELHEYKGALLEPVWWQIPKDRT